MSKGLYFTALTTIFSQTSTGYGICFFVVRQMQDRHLKVERKVYHDSKDVHKCLRWFSLCFRSLFSQYGVALKLFIYSDVLGEVWCLESFSYPDGSGRKFEGMKVRYIHEKIPRGVLFLYRNLLETIFNNILNTVKFRKKPRG